MSEIEQKKIIQDALFVARLVNLSLATRLAKAITSFLDGFIHFEELNIIYQEVPISLRKMV